MCRNTDWIGNETLRISAEVANRLGIVTGFISESISDALRQLQDKHEKEMHSLKESLEQMQDAATLALALIPDENSQVRSFLIAIEQHCKTSRAKAGGQG